jgi:hypothetical protein
MITEVWSRGNEMMAKGCKASVKHEEFVFTDSTANIMDN